MKALTSLIFLFMCLTFQAQNVSGNFLAEAYQTHLNNHVIKSTDFDEIDINKIDFSKLKKLNYKIYDEFGTLVKEGKDFNGELSLLNMRGGAFDLFIWRGKGKFVQQVRLLRL
jgi:hypothetical protein